MANQKKNKTNDPNLTLCRRILFVRLFWLLFFAFKTLFAVQCSKRTSDRGKITKENEMSIYHSRTRAVASIDCRLYFISYFIIFFPVLLCGDSDLDFRLCLQFTQNNDDFLMCVAVCRCFFFRVSFGVYSDGFSLFLVLRHLQR